LWLVGLREADDPGGPNMFKRLLVCNVYVSHCSSSTAVQHCGSPLDPLSSDFSTSDDDDEKEEWECPNLLDYYYCKKKKLIAARQDKYSKYVFRGLL
jgi:hypothetical protein